MAEVVVNEQVFKAGIGLLESVPQGVGRAQFLIGLLGMYLAEYPPDCRAELMEQVVEAAIRAAEAVDAGMHGAH